MAFSVFNNDSNFLLWPYLGSEQKHMSQKAFFFAVFLHKMSKT